MELTNLTKKRFVSDFKLPIDILEEPYFSQKIEALDEVFDTKRKLTLLFEAIDFFGSENNFLSEGNRLIRNIQDSIRSTDGYQKLEKNNLSEMSKFTVETMVKFDFTKNLYVEPHLGKTFVSIDLVKANFNAFKKMNVFNYDSYEDLIETFTDVQYFKECKSLRQIIFGQLLPKKEQIIEKNEIFTILSFLNTSIFKNKQPDTLLVNNDEIIFEIDSIFDFEQLKTIDFPSTFPLRIEKFTLKGIKDKKDKLYFIKDFGDKKELKKVPKLYYVQAYKKMMNKNITEDDLVFFYEGNAVKFLESVF